MASNYVIISNLAEETAKEIVRDPDSWMSYLATAARLYKYPFHEQLLIYAQRPDASACAEIDIWNGKLFHCWVNKGADGIALIDEDAPSPCLKYVYDISDVHAARRIGRYPYIWTMQEEHAEPILLQLEKTYGSTSPEKDFIGRMQELAERVADDYVDEAASELFGAAEGSYLEGLDEYPMKIRLRGTLQSSICYTLLTRCGIDSSLYMDELNFDNIHEFNTPSVLSVLGSATTELCKPILIEIKKVIRDQEKEFVEESVANLSEQHYNALKYKSKGHELNKIVEQVEAKEAKIIRRSEKNGTDLSKERGLQYSKYQDGPAAGGDVDEVWDHAEGVFKGEQERNIFGNASGGQTEEPLAADTKGGRGADGDTDKPNGAESGRDGGNEGKEPDAMGTVDEQHSPGGGGNRSDRSGLQLNSGNDDRDDRNYRQLSLFPGKEEQIGNIAAEYADINNAYSAASFISEEMVDLPPEVSNERQEADTAENPPAVNYRIVDDSLGEGGQRQKFARNMVAVKMLQKIEREGRNATPDEQEVLAGYVGWGGLADAFDGNKSAWHEEFLQLRELLSAEEYSCARASTLNAHYTPPVVIRSIYEAVGNMGFAKGNILEPAMGIGNFLGMLPDNMQDSRLYGVELDSLTGRIAKLLYPKANIQVKGFEETEFPNNFFDVIVGNVPFGQYKVADRPYDKHNFLVHDYFLAKSLDKVRDGGVVAVITSKGTMDKKNPAVRKYFAQRAELIGAVRLPNTTFLKNAGTGVTSDILFFKKRDRIIDIEPAWVHLGENEDRISLNSYFIDHPEMIVGRMEMVSGPFGMEATCQPLEGKPFAAQLKNAISHISGKIDNIEWDEVETDSSLEIIPADPDVRNYSYTIVDGNVYYRENSVMKPVEESDSTLERIKGMTALRDMTQGLINCQLEEYGDDAVREKQEELSELYDSFTEKYGLINSRTNKRAFSQDSSYCLLCSLEVLDDDGTLKRKADMFTKRTIKRQEVVTSVDTVSEALSMSMAEKARVDLVYMAGLTGKTEEEVIQELTGIIFKNPANGCWETADEYLSGNVRLKLKMAEMYAQESPAFAANVRALESVQPKDLDASEIEVRLGATWLEPGYINDFMADIFKTPKNRIEKDIIGVRYSEVTGQWRVSGKNADYGNPIVEMTYGTARANAYRILEDSLNLKDCRIYDVVYEDGQEKRVLNKKETMIASQKQESVRETFRDWVFRDAQRREEICRKYNDLFNSNRPRVFDGSHLQFPGMSPDIMLRPHQKNAVARQLYGNNTLLAHCVGAGKTFEMIAAAMEHKRLGLAQKALFVVPKHLTGQWASDFLQLYPGANILAATARDFEPANRKKFCSRIATGDYDAVIIGHSQFEKIPLSKERQEAIIERQIEEIAAELSLLKAEKGEQFTIKQMEKTKKSLEVRLEKLNNSMVRDDVITFEKLGVDRLFVDESHYFKNLFLYTKMRNVAGIAQTEAQKSSDMFAKCQYMDELTGGKGITFATGTPLSNSMTVRP